MMFRAITAAVLLVMALLPTLFYLGPGIEARIAPVLTIDAVDVRFGKAKYEDVEQQVIFFKTHVVKSRPCELEVFSFRWLLDHSVAVTPVFVTEDGLPFQPSSVITIGEFTSRELWTVIPKAAYNYSSTILRGTAYFKCHALWPLAFYFEIKLDIPNLAHIRTMMRIERIRTMIADRRRMVGP